MGNTHRLTSEAGNGGQRQFSLDKAGADFRAVAAWLQDRTPTEKLTGVLLVTLLFGDVQAALRECGWYRGSIGQDLFADWQQEVKALAGQTRSVSNPATIAQLVSDLELLAG